MVNYTLQPVIAMDEEAVRQSRIKSSASLDEKMKANRPQTGSLGLDKQSLPPQG